MTEIVETARAKINLALHVTGRRSDGYHLLESIVTFTETGDRLTFRRAAVDRFTVTGPFASALSNDSGNLVLLARDAWRDALSVTGGVAIHLHKYLPVASGIGGGSADAAACLRALPRLWDLPPDQVRLTGIGLTLGADVPMCVLSRPLFASGIGERLDPVDTLPALPLVLVNPLVEIATATVFAGLRSTNNPPIPRMRADALDGWVAALARLRNDLEPAAEAAVPVISDVRQSLIDNGALLARMSGSGATCFGIFADPETARGAAERIRAASPKWYIAATSTVPSQEQGGPIR